MKGIKERDNVEKVVLKDFYDADVTPLESGTAGLRTRVYDWQQVVENYTWALNIREYPFAMAMRRKVNAEFGEGVFDYGNLYLIFYERGQTSTKEMGDFINYHHDKDHTFIKGAGFVLMNWLHDDTKPRVFSISSTSKHKDAIDDMALRNNEVVKVSADANNAAHHGLLAAKGWSGLRGSLVWRAINDLITTRSAAPRPVEYSNERLPVRVVGTGVATPLAQRLPEPAFEVRDRRKGDEWVHAAELIAARERMVLLTLQIDDAVERGDVAKVEAVLGGSEFARAYAQRDGGWQGFYAPFKAKVVAARNEFELAAAFKEAEDGGWVRSVVKAAKSANDAVVAAKWAKHKQTHRAKALKRW